MVFPILIAVFGSEARASDITVVHAFEGQPAAAIPSGGLFPLAGDSSRFVGTTEQGGAYNAGTIYTVGTDGGDFLVVHEFDPANDGQRPTGVIVQDVDGWIYGTTRTGESVAADGTIFRLKFDGSGFEVLHRFNKDLEGSECWAGVVIASDGRLYGVARQGGSHSFGTIYSLNRDGTDFKVLRNFQSGADDGAYPCGDLVVAADGLLYGTTYSGGATGYGTIFKWNPDTAAFTIIHSFDPDVSGYHPVSGLAQTSDARLWGTTPIGGPLSGGMVYSIEPDGSGFQVERDFDALLEGEYATGGLSISDDGTRIYGTTTSGGSGGAGTVFEIDRGADGNGPRPFPIRVAGAFAQLATGFYPAGRSCYRSMSGGSLVLFGVASSGGPNGKGTLWRVDVAPPVVSDARLINMSARAVAGSGGDTFTVGFSISGTGTKHIVIRGVGPKLADFGVSDFVADPAIRLYRLDGTFLAENDNWASSTAADAGGFSLPVGSKDAALDVSLAAGGYTVQLINPGNDAEALIEVYDIGGDTSARLVNLSCRLNLAAGRTVIFGAALEGGSRPILVRNVGPSLAPYLLPADQTRVAQDPYLRFYDGDGTLLGENDNWDAALAPKLAAAGAFPLEDGSKDAADRLVMAPGLFSVHASTVGGGGIILVEMYDSP